MFSRYQCGEPEEEGWNPAFANMTGAMSLHTDRQQRRARQHIRKTIIGIVVFTSVAIPVRSNCGPLVKSIDFKCACPQGLSAVIPGVICSAAFEECMAALHSLPNTRERMQLANRGAAIHRGTSVRRLHTVHVPRRLPRRCLGRPLSWILARRYRAGRVACAPDQHARRVHGHEVCHAGQDLAFPRHGERHPQVPVRSLPRALDNPLSPTCSGQTTLKYRCALAHVLQPPLSSTGAPPSSTGALSPTCSNPLSSTGALPPAASQVPWHRWSLASGKYWQSTQ